MIEILPSRLLPLVEAFIKEVGTSDTAFGTAAMHDTGFVYNLRNGREPRESTVNKVISYIGMTWSDEKILAVLATRRR